MFFFTTNQTDAGPPPLLPPKHTGGSSTTVAPDSSPVLPPRLPITELAMLTKISHFSDGYRTTPSPPTQTHKRFINNRCTRFFARAPAPFSHNLTYNGFFLNFSFQTDTGPPPLLPPKHTGGSSTAPVAPDSSPVLPPRSPYGAPKPLLLPPTQAPSIDGGETDDEAG